MQSLTLWTIIPSAEVDQTLEVLVEKGHFTNTFTKGLYDTYFRGTHII